MEIVATHIKILKISQLKKLRGNEAKEVIRPQIKRNQFGQISKAVTWQFSLYFVFRHVEMRQASNMKEWCQRCWKSTLCAPAAAGRQGRSDIRQSQSLNQG